MQWSGRMDNTAHHGVPVQVNSVLMAACVDHQLYSQMAKLYALVLESERTNIMRGYYLTACLHLAGSWEQITALLYKYAGSWNRARSACLASPGAQQCSRPLSSPT